MFIRSVAKLLNMARSTVPTILQKHRNTGGIENLSRSPEKKMKPNWSSFQEDGNEEQKGVCLHNCHTCGKCQRSRDFRPDSTQIKWMRNGFAKNSVESHKIAKFCNRTSKTSFMTLKVYLMKWREQVQHVLIWWTNPCLYVESWRRSYEEGAFVAWQTRASARYISFSKLWMQTCTLTSSMTK